MRPRRDTRPAAAARAYPNEGRLTTMATLAREDDEIGSAAGLAAESLVGDDQRGAGDQDFADALDRLRRHLDAFER